VNLSSTITIAREVSKIMIKQSGGCIVNIGSVIGSHGSVGQSIYAASKAGLVGFSKSLAKELAPKQIRVNVVAPGFIDTPMTQGLSEARRQQLLSQIPLQRFGQADEVAELVEYLLNARYVTGQEMTIDGGLCV
jgi:NAD(P)-dependent dehydrogenase (short-subunit alcohol dehydrogenase family)